MTTRRPLVHRSLDPRCYMHLWCRFPMISRPWAFLQHWPSSYCEVEEQIWDASASGPPPRSPGGLMPYVSIQLWMQLPQTHGSSFLVQASSVAAAKLSQPLAFQLEPGSCPPNQNWPRNNGLTFFPRSCLHKISQNVPSTFKNLANHLNCCYAEFNTVSYHETELKSTRKCSVAGQEICCFIFLFYSSLVIPIAKDAIRKKCAFGKLH